MGPRLLDEEDTFFGCKVDHIINEKHGGPTVAENLAYACAFCNRAKGSDIGSIVWSTGDFNRFFHPRTDRRENRGRTRIEREETAQVERKSGLKSGFPTTYRLTCQLVIIGFIEQHPPILVFQYDLLLYTEAVK